MPPAKRSALALAAQLRGMADEELIALLRSREIRDSGIRDFFDLADRLLERSNVQLALSKLDRHALLNLKSERADSAALTDLALAVDGHPYDAVAELLASWPAGLLEGSEPAALAPVSQVDIAVIDRAAAERAFATTFSVLELLDELGRQPARELARGGIALPDSKRLATAANVQLEQLPALVAVAASADLIALGSGVWAPTAAASTWQLLGTVDRWLSLSRSWVDTLPGDLRTLLAQRRHSAWGDHLDSWVRWLYPAGGDWMSGRILEQEQRATLLGLTFSTTPSTAAAHLLAGEAELAKQAIAPLFPVEVEKVYLQHDLSIVSPGPLAAPLDSRLRLLADVESRELATTYRISAESLDRAIAAGETAESLRELLATISLSGVPQPLDYLITETARRHALVRVGADAAGTYVRSDDENLLTTIHADQRLGSLGLTSDGPRLRSRLDSQVVFWALSDARYPVSAERRDGSIVSVKRELSGTTAAAVRDHAREIVERLRATAGPENHSATAWLERQLDLAIKARVAVAVTVTMPNGSLVDYLLEPTGLGGGRLRARDRKADIERTLPLSSITEVRPAD
jgi:hypothetical protein